MMGGAVSRRDLLVRAPVAAGALTVLGLGDVLVAGDDAGKEAPTLVTPEFPSQDRALVRAVVGAAHTDFDRVKELVTARPELAKSAYDWGFGDWESALGAASHMGRRDIAEFLMEHGARPNFFTFAMLGKLPAVKQMVESMPGIQKTLGPHGISVLWHARMGARRQKDKANLEVVEYLESLGDANGQVTNLEVSDQEKKAYLGRYDFGPGPEGYFEVLLDSRGMLSLRRGERTARKLLRVEPHGFAASGAPSVRIRFQVVEDQAKSLTIHIAEPVLTAQRRT